MKKWFFHHFFCVINITNTMTNIEIRDFVSIFSGKGLISIPIMESCAEFTYLTLRFHLLSAAQIHDRRARCHMRKWSKPPGWVSTEITVYSQYSNLNDNAALWLVLFLSPPFPMLGSDWSFTSLAPSRQMPLSDWSLLLPTLLLVKCCALIGRISIASALIGPFYHSTSANAALWGFLSETQWGECTVGLGTRFRKDPSVSWKVFP